MLPHDILLVVANMCGWPGGLQNKVARTRTDDLIAAVLGEFDQMPIGPKLMVGDFNAELRDLTSLSAVLSEGTFLDLGEHASLIGQPRAQPTCFPNNDGAPFQT